jgi:hypothetical protein
MDLGPIIGNIIMAAGVIISVIAIFVTIMQARRAEAARVGAEAAGDRAAAALEQLAAIERARDEARIPWIVSREGTGGDRWRVVNNTGGIARNAHFTPRGSGYFHMEDEQQRRDVANGSPVFIGFGGSIADPSTMAVHVQWADISGNVREAEITLG